jgi:hypothetical protein
MVRTQASRARRGRRLLAAALLLVAARGQATGVDPEGLGLHWAWSANAGWIDALPAGPPGSGLRLQDGLLSGWLWSPNVGWISASCADTGSCTESGYRLWLEADAPGLLRLVGTAWSPNAGWIVAHCATTASCHEVGYGLRVHLGSGIVEGFAWSENLGWISFSCSNTASCTTVDFGLQFDPAALLRPEGVFRDGFED